MTPRRFQMNSRPTHSGSRSRGFSLLEALIAVVVLSTGLLALAALQSAIIRSSVDARIRSSAATAAVAVLEDLRAGGYQAIPTGANTVNVATENYIVPDPAVSGGFAITYNSETWFDNGVGGFTTTAPGSGDPVPLAEFKKIDITVGWTDPYGSGQRNLVFTDLVGPLGASLTSPDLSQLGSTLNNQRPIVITQNPEGPGVIPIAVGDGEDTAATNPKPVIKSQGNKSSVIETRFDVLNFSSGGDDLPDGFVQIQKRVETSIVGCRCQSGATGALTGVFGAQFRPTFWDGTRYVPPEPTGASPTAGPKPSGTGQNSFVQSELCTDCCRDHHDPTGVEVKFDPFRPDPHDHYVVNPSGTPPVLASGSNAEYLEACRLIRVDGLWRVATDLNNEFFGLLKTTTVAGKLAADPVPDPNATPVYEEFVIDALKSRFVSQTPVDLAALYDSKGLNEQPIGITLDSSDSRWLHARGFFVDYIEPAAQQVIDEARSNCPSGTPTENCVLPFVPFTTINLTELARWNESRTGVIQVSKGTATLGTNPLNPLRGKVNAIGSNPNEADAVAAVRRSNSGLTVSLVSTRLPDPIDPDDQQIWDDQQGFQVGGGGTNPPSGAEFTVQLIGVSGGVANLPGVDSNIAVGGQCDPPMALTSPYLCRAVPTLPVSNASIEVLSYNPPTPDSGVTRSLSVFCGPNDSVSTRYDAPTCQNFRVSSAVSSSGFLGSVTVTGQGMTAERSSISFATINDSDLISVIFELQPQSEWLTAEPVGVTRLNQKGIATCAVSDWVCPSQ